uniref:Protein-serine/threonine kinase n=1 Tax=Ditylenchus dipsaci TaxID=166011 RepID=A0A915CQM2_9BILA
MLSSGGGQVQWLKPLDFYSRFRPASLTMKQYLDFGRTGTAESSYQFLRTELLVRMSNIMKEFDLLPLSLLQTPSAQLVEGWYKQSFEELLQFRDLEPSKETNTKFNNQIRQILRRHNTVVETMAEAIIELKESSGIDMASERNIQYFLDRFYLNRISIRMLQNQHLSIFAECGPESNGHVGHIDPHCNVREIIIDAYENARALCEQHYCVAPYLDLHCVDTIARASETHADEHEVTVPLVPLHLYYIVFEVIKNAMRATIDHHARADQLPEIKVMVILGNENLSIKVSDQGGGVPQRKLDHLFHYLYSTAPQPRRNQSSTPFAGYGYGLPISRLYARYFLGDLFLFSMEGWGTDACIHFKANPAEASELLPVYGSYSRRILSDISPKVPDWCFQERKTPKTITPPETSRIDDSPTKIATA